MRIPSGKTDQNIYFIGVDATDLKTRETGLSSFTVYRSRNGAAEVQYTTPTITEIDTTNMPGVYALLVDEDTTIASGSDSEEYCVHITHAGMAPVTRTIELYRRDTTSGQTIDVSSGGVEVGTFQAGAITAAAIATDAIDADALADGAITAATFAAGAITATVIATDAIDADALADNAITAATFAAGAIDATAIANGAIDAATFAAGAIDATAIANGAIDAATFAAGAIDAAAIADNAIDAGAIAADAITAAKIADGAIDANTFAAGAITATAIAADAIGSSELAATAVNEIADGILDRDMSTGTDSGSATVRTVRQALRFLRNKWDISGTTLTVHKEDDATASWTATITATAGADPITGNDPSGP